MIAGRNLCPLLLFARLVRVKKMFSLRLFTILIPAALPLPLRSPEGVGASDPQAERPPGPHRQAALPGGGRPPAAHHVDQRRPQHPQRLDPLQGAAARSSHQGGGDRGCRDVHMQGHQRLRQRQRQLHAHRYR